MLGSPAYNAALQVLTDEITMPDPASGHPNGSLLNQLRSNEFLPPTAFWDLREWNVLPPGGNPDASLLTNVTVQQTPRRSTLTNPAGRDKLGRYLDNNRAAILAGTHVVPLLFEGAPFLAGNSINDMGHPLPPGFVPSIGGTLWWATGYDGVGMTVEGALVRHNFALNTCSGCHFHETDTDFSQVTNRVPGSPTQLSTFLTGSPAPIPDPVSPMALDSQGQLVPVEHVFDDLRRRAAVMKRTLEISCGSPAALPTLQAIEAAMGSRPH